MRSRTVAMRSPGARRAFDALAGWQARARLLGDVPPPDPALAAIRRITVVIADDHPGFRDALRCVIDAEPDMSVVAAVPDGLAALDAIRDHAPGVALLDVRMPGLDGIEVARRLAAERSPSRTVIVTSHRDQAVLERALAAGASCFLPKDTALTAVVAVVRAVARAS